MRGGYYGNLNFFMKEKYLSKGHFAIFPNVPIGKYHVYWVLKNTNNEITRIGITSNPYLIESKRPDNFHLEYFPINEYEEAETLANEMIVDLTSIGQHLYNCYTLGQANYRIKKVSHIYDIESIIKDYNEANGTSHKIYRYQGKEWVNKRVIDDYISMVEFLNNR